MTDTEKPHPDRTHCRWEEAGRAPADRLCDAFAVVALWVHNDHYRARGAADILLSLGSDEIDMEWAQEQFRELLDD